jgi:peptidoglycan/LPS O-acetylase OafA/YrhL
MRIATLTGLRGIAAVSVMLYHIPHQPAFHAFAMPLFARGYLMVDLFFILSGFVISIGYYDRVMGSGGTRQYGDFLVNRLARVWPLHLVVMLVFTARFLVHISGTQGVALTPANLITNIFMIQSWGWGAQPIAGNSWSVSTEVAAYLLFPLIAWLAVSRRTWGLVAAAGALLLLVASSGRGASGPMDVIDSDTVLTLLRCLAGFALGVVAWRCMGRRWCRALLDRPASFACVGIALGLAFLIPGGDLAVIALLPLLVLSCAYDRPMVRALLANPLSVHLGLISYSIYLWHPLVRDMAARAMTIAHGRGLVGWEIAFVIGMGIATWLLSWASYHLVEIRGHQFIKGLQARLQSRGPPVVAAL